MFCEVHPTFGKTKHECHPVCYIDEAHKEQVEPELQKIESDMEEDDLHACTCNLLALTWKIKDVKIEKMLADQIVFTMFQSLRFKTLVGFAYISNFRYLHERERSYDQNRFTHLSVQILTVPALSLAIMKQDALSK